MEFLCGLQGPSVGLHGDSWGYRASGVHILGPWGVGPWAYVSASCGARLSC